MTHPEIKVSASLMTCRPTCGLLLVPTLRQPLGLYIHVLKSQMLAKDFQRASHMYCLKFVSKTLF